MLIRGVLEDNDEQCVILQVLPSQVLVKEHAGAAVIQEEKDVTLLAFLRAQASQEGAALQAAGDATVEVTALLNFCFLHNTVHKLKCLQNVGRCGVVRWHTNVMNSPSSFSSK